MAVEENKNFKDRGTIVEIKLENFITYRNAVIYPGRHLNVIIGPNGTGKSTIATALALGFGGTPKLIGKPEMPVGATVKNDCQKARIDIVVRHTPTANMTFTRTIDRQSKSNYFINDNSIAVSKFKEKVKEFRIQVDNLTQFLPQENIKGFSELTGKQLLLNTERSISDTTLETHHTTLKDNRARQKVLEADIRKRSERLAVSEQHYTTLSEEVQQFKERKNLKKKLAALKQKRAWIRYDIQRTELLEAKKRRDDAAREMKTCDDRLAPIDDAIRTLQSELKTLDRKFVQTTTKMRDFNKNFKKYLDDIDDLNHMIKMEEQKCVSEIENEKKRDDKINAQRKLSEKFENDMVTLEEEFGAENDLRRRMDELTPQIEFHRSMIIRLSEESNMKKTEIEQMTYQINNLRQEQQALKDIELKRMELLMRRSKDAHAGVIWLRQNQHLFRKRVWEPMMLHIHVKDSKYSKFFENIIAWKDLVAFVCEDKDDMGLLLNHLRTRQKLKVNAVYSDIFKPVTMTPRVSLNEIKRLGFTHYLIDLIEAPDPILKWIVSMYHLQNIPIGTNRVDETFDQVPPSFFTFFSFNKNFHISMSKYSKQRSTSIRGVMSTGTLSLNLDSVKVNEIEGKIGRLTQMKDVSLKHFEELQEKITQQKIILEEFREKRATLASHYARIQNTGLKMAEAERKLLQLEAERTDIEDIKKKRDGAIKNLVRKQMNVYGKINESSQEIFRVAKICESIELQVQEKNSRISEKQRESRELRVQAREAERVYKDLDAAMVEMNSKTRELQGIARDLTGGVTPHDKEAFKHYNAAFARLPPDIPGIDELMENTRVRIYVSKDNPDAENRIKEYETLGAQIETYKTELEAMNEELTINQEETERIKQMWLPPLQALVNRIRGNFSGYLEKLGCAGDVALVHGDNPNDFEDYALKIMVKFRDNEPLQEFAKNRQSGGETSLTTAMFMLALQDMSQVPFRCVDEINQGMDATNDRKVFEHIMNITAKGNSSQYFLLTPKLLPNLPYNESVTILCVFNGPGVIPHNDWTIQKYLEKLRARKRLRK
ncbi:structural maintenance of chromosomes protein 5 [Fopius arisanus]|uniref:Structural maintenance of chromosomes protein 5 n=1 Tax=Fopius arisanus TaxID=64838 RepID=A0A9R1TL99_9HYME|nr:PREDICTED: structural maintenance of chromosomes protein 5 [Fopius arisanus]XP_011310908.1 PREDICTED: structural maintenance of chromosomes protein 5 [Fopius arisanus]